MKQKCFYSFGWSLSKFKYMAIMPNMWDALCDEWLFARSDKNEDSWRNKHSQADMLTI